MIDKNVELKRITESLDTFSLLFMAGKVYRDFIRDVENNAIREDGSCQLFNIIDYYISADPKVINVLKRGKKLYRARIIENDKLEKSSGIEVYSNNVMVGFDESNSREAPLGMSAPGRNNISGVSYLYLADRQETACVEVKPKVQQLISVAEFMVSKTMHIVDFSHDYRFAREESVEQKVALGPLFTYIMTQYVNPVVDPIEYRATQILTDHIRKTGIDGISYKSFFDEQGKNYTIFNSSRDYFKFSGSKIVMLQSERRTFLDFNEHRIRDAKTVGSARYDALFAEEVVNEVRKKLNDEK